MSNIRQQTAVLVAIIVVTATVVFTLVKNVNSQQSRPGQEGPSEEVLAVRRGGLREAARLKHEYVSTMNTAWRFKFSLEGLTKNSSDVVIGVPVSHATQLNEKGNLVTTEYRIQIEQTLKGDLKGDEPIIVTLTGGKIVFEDGTSAEIKTPDLEHLKEGGRYILFLTPRGNLERTFLPTAAGQGIFEIDAKGIKPHGDRFSFVKNYKGQTVELFLEEVKAAIQKYPDPGKCCQ